MKVMKRTIQQALELDSLISWLEKQPQHKTYKYADFGNCLIAQYLRSKFKDAEIAVGGYSVDVNDTTGVEMPLAVQNIAVGRPYTFGAALERAKAANRQKEKASSVK